jgi:chaperonin GroES
MVKKMELTADNKFRKLIVVGDRVLIKPKKDEERTKSGLYLPPGVKEKEQIQSGYIMKAGPGYPIPVAMEENESWKDKDENVKYVPLQAKEGDLAIFLQKGAIEVIYQEEKYFIVPQSSILMLEREEDLFN